MFSLKMFSLMTRVQMKMMKITCQKNAFFSSVFTIKQNPLKGKSGLINISKKHKCEDLEVNLDQDESMRMEEYDKIMIDLSNKAIQESNYHQTMMKLLDICLYMSKYAEYMEGWEHILVYFENNFEKLNNQDFLSFFNGFTSLRVRGSTDDMWGRPIRNLIHNRTDIPNIDFLRNIVHLPMINYFVETPELVDEMLNKISSMNLSNSEEVLYATSFLSEMNLDVSHNLWTQLQDRFSQAVNVNERSNYLDFINASNSVAYTSGIGINGYGNSVQTFKNSFFNQINRLNVQVVITVTNKLAECGQFNENELGQVLNNISKSVSDLHPLVDSKLKLTLIITCLRSPTFQVSLAQNKYPNFNAPSKELIEAFERDYNQVKDKGYLALIELYRGFEVALNEDISERDFLNYEESRKLQFDL